MLLRLLVRFAKGTDAPNRCSCQTATNCQTLSHIGKSIHWLDASPLRRNGIATGCLNPSLVTGTTTQLYIFLQVQQPFSSDHTLLPDLLEETTSIAEPTAAAANAASTAAGQEGPQASSNAASSRAGPGPATRQSPLRKRLSRLFSVLSPDKAPVQQGQSTQSPAADQAQAANSPGAVIASTPTEALIASAPSQAGPLNHQLSAATLVSASALQISQATRLPSIAAMPDRSNNAALSAQPEPGVPHGLHHEASAKSTASISASPRALQPPSLTPTPPAALRYSIAPSTTSKDDGGHWLRSPRTGQGLARSMSETVLALSADLQLSRDCAQALSLQLGSQTDVHQLQGKPCLHSCQARCDDFVSTFNTGCSRSKWLEAGLLTRCLHNSHSSCTAAGHAHVRLHLPTYMDPLHGKC